MAPLLCRDWESNSHQFSCTSLRDFTFRLLFRLSYYSFGRSFSSLLVEECNGRKIMSSCLRENSQRIKSKSPASIFYGGTYILRHSNPLPWVARTFHRSVRASDTLRDSGLGVQQWHHVCFNDSPEFDSTRQWHEFSSLCFGPGSMETQSRTSKTNSSRFFTGWSDWTELVEAKSYSTMIQQWFCLPRKLNIWKQS